jgi:hypothetical protein
MGYDIQAIVGLKEGMEGHVSDYRNARLVSLPQGFALIPMTDDLYLEVGGGDLAGCFEKLSPEVEAWVQRKEGMVVEKGRRSEPTLAKAARQPAGGGIAHPLGDEGGLMVLVDTSVWIRFLAGREPYASGLADLLGQDDVAGHEMIFGELLLGDIGGSRQDLLDAYTQMHHAATVPHEEVVE